MLSSHLCSGLPNSPSHQVSRLQFFMHVVCLPCLLLAPRVSSCFACWHWSYLLKSINYGTCNYVIFSVLNFYPTIHTHTCRIGASFCIRLIFWTLVMVLWHYFCISFSEVNQNFNAYVCLICGVRISISNRSLLICRPSLRWHLKIEIFHVLFRKFLVSLRTVSPLNIEDLKIQAFKPRTLGEFFTVWLL
jgi:hypothetical protein